MAALDPCGFLKTLGAFSGWDQVPALAEALADLARRCETWSFQEGDLVRFPDEASPGPTWVVEGCLVVLETDSPRYVGVREELRAALGLWIRGQTSGRFLVVPEASWAVWLGRHPSAAERLGEPLPQPLPRNLVQSPLVLEPGETPLHLFRKAPLFLGLRAALPAFFFLLFLSFGLVLQLNLGTSVPALALWFLPGLGMLVTAGLIALVTWEWRVSVLAITDRSVLVRQIDVWAHRSDFEKMALEKVREAVFRKSGWFDTFLGLVALELEGDSPKGRLVFGGLAQDSRFLTAMTELKRRRELLTPTRKIIRRALADRSGGARSPILETPATKVESQGPKPRTLSWRVERHGVIWFRRHPWLVFQRCLPWGGWTALAVALGLFAAGLAPEAAGAIALVAALFSLLPLGRIGWEIWDWADDRLSIQGEKVVMVHRRPLWLGEVRQEGTLDQIQQVGVRKDTLTALVLDFGVVTINLGAGPPLEFSHASHPEWVQNEIFYRRTLLNQNREQQAAKERLEEVSEILDTWDEARKAGFFSEKPDRTEKTNQQDTAKDRR